MTTISTQKLIYSKEINKVLDPQFSSLVPKPSEEVVASIPTVDEFFDNYNTLFYEIPLTGSNSHAELVEKSSEYLGLDLNVLVEQINFLEEQNKQLQKQIDEFNTGEFNLINT
jgi:hypothetical protein